MGLRLTFLGAVGSVTGSRYLLEADDARILVDSGMFQERQNLGLNWENYGLSPARLDAVVITHAHMDHSGWLPKLVKDGFHGPIYCTSPTADLIPIIINDIAKIQEEDARNKAKRHAKEGRKPKFPPVPLYTGDDAAKTIKQLRPVAALGESVQVAKGVTATWNENGHILGATWVEIDAGGKRIVFSGDIGRWDRPILNDPIPPRQADYVVIESTYGNRNHVAGDVEEQLGEVIAESAARGGNLLIPSFSVERAQELLHSLSSLMYRGKLAHEGIYLDSPMATRATKVYTEHPEAFDEEMRELMQTNRSPFSFPGLHYVESPDDSKRLNNIRKDAVIIAGNGMCTGGRIKHHLLHHLSRTETIVLFVGFQAPGTLGRQLLEGVKEVRLFNTMIPVRAEMRQLYGISGHADQTELLRWAGDFAVAPTHCFVTHGEPESASALAGVLHERYGWQTSTPSLRESATL